MTIKIKSEVPLTATPDFSKMAVSEINSEFFSGVKITLKLSVST